METYESTINQLTEDTRGKTISNRFNKQESSILMIQSDEDVDL